MNYMLTKVIPWSENEDKDGRGFSLVGHEEERGKPKPHQSGKPNIPFERGPSMESVKLIFLPSRKKSPY